MLTSALRAVVRPTVARAFRPAAARPVVARAALSTSAARWSAAAPLIQGEGAKPGEVPTDEEHATGLARLQLLGDLAGEPAFDYAALDSSRVGTLQDPIKVYSLDTSRLVGCSGCPADSHDTIWFNVEKDKIRRCPECGSAYTIDFHGEEHHGDHHH